MIRTSQLDPNFKNEIANEPGGENIKRCFNCTGCTVGCPVSEIGIGFNPRKIIRKALLGMRNQVLTDEYIWLCAFCYLCYERCPQNVKINEVIGAIRTIAQKEARAGNIKLRTPKFLFDSMFIDSVRKNGRWHETAVTSMFMLKTKGISGIIDYASIGLKLFKKGKLSILPHKIRGTDQIERMMREVRK